MAFLRKLNLSAGFERILANIGYLFSENVFNMGLSLVGDIYVARYLSPENYGLIKSRPETTLEELRNVEPQIRQSDITKARNLLDLAPKVSGGEGLENALIIFSNKSNDQE